MLDQFDEEFWNERYRSHSSLWSGNPNAHLISEAEHLSPGSALDIGSGEGADAIWLARRGWWVTAVDWSAVAIGRGVGHAAQAGSEIAERVDWQQADLTVWQPGPARYELVSSQYMHMAAKERDVLFGRLATAVAPGGTLLVVGHHPSDTQTTVPRPPFSELYFTGEDILTVLDSREWEVITNAARPRPATDPEGRAVTIHDTVFTARKRA